MTPVNLTKTFESATSSPAPGNVNPLQQAKIQQWANANNASTGTVKSRSPTVSRQFAYALNQPPSSPQALTPIVSCTTTAAATTVTTTIIIAAAATIKQLHIKTTVSKLNPK